ncbi:hypothetical protein N656DRAFT_612203 [Canariomyces notabilis]|uniref:Uncharacterized protein n=1 Tax=Canariomyces notabilis TaxID=2074819 RepID=A0AAN6TH21_9PEZI|nr:hypothetical protein N656DRAFT_612203 [Canariomyces arenarius]
MKIRQWCFRLSPLHMDEISWRPDQPHKLGSCLKARIAQPQFTSASRCETLFASTVNSIFSASPKRGQAFRSSCSRALTSTVGQGWTLGAGHDDISCAKRAQAASCVVNFIKLMIMYRSLQSGPFQVGSGSRWETRQGDQELDQLCIC